MTMKQKLIRMEEIKKRNEEFVRLFLSGEPIHKRTDPRYLAKLAVKEAVHSTVHAIPEVAGLSLVMIAMLVIVPAMFSVIGG